MKLLHKILLIVFIAVTAFSCTAPIDITTDDSEPRLVIFGYVTNEQKAHTVRISTTNGYFSPERPPVISGADVTLTVDNMVMPLYQHPDSIGIYRTNASFRGEEGKTYILDVLLDYDNDGVKEHYRAEASMPYATRVDSVKLRPSVLPGIPDLLLYGYVPEIQSNNLALYIIKNNEPKAILEYFLIIPDWYFKGNDIDGYEFPCMVRDGILTGDTITFRVNSFSDDFSEFISHSKSEAGGSNPLFGGPPADVKSNFVKMNPDNPVAVVGFFGAFPTSVRSTIAERDFIFFAK